MTFYEAALRVLEESGAPLHSTEITKRAIDRHLLSHIGKTPEVTMLSRLAAMAKRPRDRKILVTAKDTFALTDWMLTEDAEALAQTGVFEPNPEESLPPYRPIERHPEPHAEYLRAIGRQADRKRGRDDEGKRKKFPPVPEVAFELLQECQTALVPQELLARMKASDLVDELGVSALLDALAEDNQARVDQGRRPNFAALRVESGELQLSVEGQAEGGAVAPVDLQRAFCAAIGLGFENGRVILKSQRQQQRTETQTTSGPAVVSPEDTALIQTARHAARDARKAMARVLRRKLGELEPGTFEKSCVRMLHALHFRELKVARRSKDGPTMTARRRDGSLELRFAIKLCRGTQAVDRRQVQDLRRDLNNHGANLGLIISAGETRGDARSEGVSGGGLVMLWCGDALAEKFFEAKTGVHVTQVELYDVDDAFFDTAQKDAEDAQKRREERHRERELQRNDAAAQPTPPMDAPVEVAAAPAEVLPPPAQEAGQGETDGPDEEGDDEGGDEEPTQGGPVEQGSEGRRRRRRRRRRRGRGGQPGVPGQPGAQAAPEGAAATPAGQPGPVETAASAAPTPPPPAEPSAASTEPAPPPAQPPES